MDKWKRVYPGDQIPAGQKYLVYQPDPPYEWVVKQVSVVLVSKKIIEVGDSGKWYVDSTWVEEKILPSTWTWGMAIYKADLGSVTNWKIGQWALTVGGSFKHKESGQMWHPSNIIDFVELTEGQAKPMMEAGIK